MCVVSTVSTSKPYFGCVGGPPCPTGWLHQDNYRMGCVLVELKYMKHLGQCVARSEYSPC